MVVVDDGKVVEVGVERRREPEVALGPLEGVERSRELVSSRRSGTSRDLGEDGMDEVTDGEGG